MPTTTCSGIPDGLSPPSGHRLPEAAQRSCPISMLFPRPAHTPGRPLSVWLVSVTSGAQIVASAFFDSGLPLSHAVRRHCFFMFHVCRRSPELLMSRSAESSPDAHSVWSPVCHRPAWFRRPVRFFSDGFSPTFIFPVFAWFAIAQFSVFHGKIVKSSTQHS